MTRQLTDSEQLLKDIQDELAIEINDPRDDELRRASMIINILTKE